MGKKENEKAATVADIIERLAINAIHTQYVLDRAHLEQTASFLEDLEAAGLTLDDPIVRSAMPVGLQIRSQTIEANIQTSQRRFKRFGVDLMMGDRIVTTFAEAAYGSEKTRYNRLTMEIEAVPIPNHSTKKE
ncbi:MAG: hypothetical protein GY859_37240 [Desulfobacterales bacterium]|nr:hypothetical protein [Desulfobacterales bacterium]